MKRLKVFDLIIVIPLVISAILLLLTFNLKNEIELLENSNIHSVELYNCDLNSFYAYYKQNRAFEMEHLFKFYSYESVNEARLFVNLHVYSLYIQNEEIDCLNLSDVENYLSNEFYDDGSARAMKRPDNIESYIDFYWNNDGKNLLSDYWKEVWIAKKTIENLNNLELPSPIDMSQEQLVEIINYIDTPNYNVNLEVFE